MADEVRIEEQAISNALGEWDTAAEQLKADYQAKAHAAFDKFNSAKWAGGDSAGDAFTSSIDVDQVNDLLKDGGQGSQVVQKVVDLGTNTRDAINKSLASDQTQADELKKPRGHL
jgi:hypothetical protein